MIGFILCLALKLARCPSEPDLVPHKKRTDRTVGGASRQTCKPILIPPFMPELLHFDVNCMRVFPSKVKNLVGSPSTKLHELAHVPLVSNVRPFAEVEEPLSDRFVLFG